MNANVLHYVGVVARLEYTLELPISEKHVEVVAISCYPFHLLL